MTDEVTEAVEAYKAAQTKHSECVSAFTLSARRLDGDRDRMHDAATKLTAAHRALLNVIGTPDEPVQS